MYISVIIAAYNVEETLEEALESLYVQTHSEWEAIIIDDGSTDGTLKIAKRFAKRDQRFRIISQPNSGVSATRNLGIKAAQHNWLLFLDADDWILPQHLERMNHVLEEDSSLDIAYCGWAYVTPDGYEVFKELPKSTGDLFILHAEGCPFAIHAYVVRRALVEDVGGFDTNLVVCEDWDLWQRLARVGARFGAIPEMLAPYRMRLSSASMDGRRIMTDGLRVLQQGHSSDGRVSTQHPVYLEGLPKEQLIEQTFYLLCSAAGLVIGQGKDARFLMDILDDSSHAKLNPYAVAECIVQSAMLSACQPLKKWHSTWRQIEPIANKFLRVLEKYSGTTNLAYRAQSVPKHLINKYTAPLSQIHKVRAHQAQLVLSAYKLMFSFTDMVRSLSWRFKRFVINSIKVTPLLYRLFNFLCRRYVNVESENFFENLFTTSNDPWNYTSKYEQTKYEQTLQLIQDGPIEDALELACAEGHFTVQLAPLVRNLLVTDISQVALNRTAKRCNKFTNMRFQRLDFIKDPIPGRFDLIVCSEVLYFTRNRKKLKAVAQKLANALKPGGQLIMAHANIVVDEPDCPGFDWHHAFGAKGIGETFAKIPSLKYVKEIQTPIYRVQLFTRESENDLSVRRNTPEIIKMEQPTPLPPEVNSQILWKGNTNWMPILMYHRVAPAGSEELAPWRVSPTAFEEQLRYLHDNGYKSVSLDDWASWIEYGYHLPRDSVIITFDDGYQDFIEYALPVLQRYKFTATIFLVTDEIGRKNCWDHDEYGEMIQLLNWREIRQLQANNISFGSHAATHRSLSSLSFRDIVREFKRSKDTLEQGIGVEVNSLAYPYGDYNRIAQYIMAICNYDIGLTCDTGFCTVKDSLFSLPRIEIEGLDTLETFASKIGIQQDISARKNTDHFIAA